MAAYDTASFVPFERDLRSAGTGIKRRKDALAKWTHGARPLPGRARASDGSIEPIDGPGGQVIKVRPSNWPSDTLWHCSYRHGEMNIHSPSKNKSSITRGDDVKELSRSILDLMAPSTGGRATATAPASSSTASADAANILYSFDNIDTPPPTLTLDAFVKPNVRATEKLIEKEYEVLDDNGDAVKGRKARRILRNASKNPPTVASASVTSAIDMLPLDDEEFELV